MKDYDEMKEEKDRGSVINLPNLLAAGALVFFLLLALGLRYIGGMEKEQSESTTATTTTRVTTTTGPTTTQTDSQTTGTAYPTEDLYEREQRLIRLESELEELAGVRSRLVTELKIEMEKTGLEMVIDGRTGDIRLSEALIFATGAETLSRQGEAYLRGFVPVYLSVVLKPEYRPYIEQIVIEGHTDDEGTYLNNLALSQRRAVNVASFIFRNGLNILADETEADSFLAVSGRSSALLIDEEGNVNRALSRRVEFKFRIKDYDIIEQMIRIIEGEG